MYNLYIFLHGCPNNMSHIFVVYYFLCVFARVTNDSLYHFVSLFTLHLFIYLFIYLSIYCVCLCICALCCYK